MSERSSLYLMGYFWGRRGKEANRNIVKNDCLREDWQYGFDDGIGDFEEMGQLIL